MVNQGAIDEELFNASGGEMVFVYAKIAKFLPELRQIFGTQELLQNMETLVKRIPNIDEKIAQMNERMKQMAAMRAERAEKEKGAQTSAAQA
jgi:predicted component of type VI protein secretion system